MHLVLCLCSTSEPLFLPHNIAEFSFVSQHLNHNWLKIRSVMLQSRNLTPSTLTRNTNEVTFSIKPLYFLEKVNTGRFYECATAEKWVMECEDTDSSEQIAMCQPKSCFPISIRRCSVRTLTEFPSKFYRWEEKPWTLMIKTLIATPEWPTPVADGNFAKSKRPWTLMIRTGRYRIWFLEKGWLHMSWHLPENGPF